MAAVGYVLVTVLAAAKVSGLAIDSDVCMSCICRAVSGCDIRRGCVGGGCGLFDIQREQWVDAGSPVQYRDDPHEKQAFQRCVLEPFCAAKTVLTYTEKYAKDCDGDGEVTCMDLFMVHLQGSKCSPRLLSSEHKQNILSCLKENERNGKSGPEENKTAAVTSTPTQPTLKSAYSSTPSTKPSSKMAFTTPVYGYPTKMITNHVYPTPRPVSMSKPSTIPPRIVYPTKVTSRPVYRPTTPHNRTTMKTTPKPMNGTQRASTRGRTFIRNSTVYERPALDS